MTNVPCYRLKAAKDKFVQARGCERPRLAYIIEVLSLLKPDLSVRELIVLFFVLTIWSGLTCSPFMSIQLFVDIYKIICFEPMHNLPSPFSNLMKNCLVCLLKDGL